MRREIVDAARIEPPRRITGTRTIRAASDDLIGNPMDFHNTSPSFRQLVPFVAAYWPALAERCVDCPRRTPEKVRSARQSRTLLWRIDWRAA